jgi:mono/diheme cytochrome c family protein
MARSFARIFAFMLAVVGIYAYVGQLLPQFEEHPPQKRVITVQTPPDELVAIGQELTRGKGGCLVCHKDAETGNVRGPDLRQAGPKAGTRKPGMSAGDYLLESLLKPGEYLVPGFPNMMPPANRPPANLNMAEVKAVIAYLQSLGGGEPAVKVLAEDLAQANAAAKPQHRGRAAMEKFGCIACHKVAGEGGTVGPELTKSAANRDPRELLAKIINPKVWTVPGYPAGLMPAGAALPEGELHEIVGYLANLAGKGYSATGAASPWSHEGVRLGLVVFLFNAAMLIALAIAGRRDRAA